jgi:hypothetical protein
MALVADRVRETTTTTGTGDITLGGAVTGFRSFNSAFGLNATFHYAIVDSTNGTWEVGDGLLSGTTTLVRSRVSASSNSNALVNFGSGTKEVFCTFIAAEYIDTSMLYAIQMNLIMR